MTRATLSYRRYLMVMLVAALTLVSYGAADASDWWGDTPVTVPSTGEEPIGTPFPNPTAVEETPEATPVVAPTLEVVELPSTGAGTTAKVIKQATCCMWTTGGYYEYEYICDRGHNDKLVWYVHSGDYFLVGWYHYISWPCNANYG